MRIRNRFAVMLSGLMAMAGAMVLMTAPPTSAQNPAPFRLANPKVTGPIPARAPLGDPSHDYPWNATFHNLKAVGYVEEEYFFEGTASRFDTPAGQTGKLRDSGHKYVTRMVVRRPIDPKTFNGAVLAEWTNVTPGYDLDAMWGASFEHIVRGGYAWVGISAQRVGLQQPPNGLKLWSPKRYAAIDVTDGGTITNDDLSYDIYAQAMQAIKHPQGVNPLGPLHAQRIIAMGASQSAARLGAFINSLHSFLGGPVDAYILDIGGARVRDDLPVPVFKILSETDIPGQVPSRQPDTNKYRQWEVVGASHSGQRTGFNSGALNRRDGVTREEAKCTYPMWPRTPINYPLGTSYGLVDRWIKDGTPPPIAPKAEIVTNPVPPAPASATGQGGRGGGRGPSPFDYKRDSHGNALGGIRLSEFDVATALQTRENTGNSFCFLYGRYEPFPDAVINQLYPSHAAYVNAVKAKNAENLKAGYIQAADAARSNRRAETSYIGSGDPCKQACRLSQDLGDETYIYLGLAKEVDKMGDDVAAITRAIARSDGAKGKPADRAEARSRLTKFVADLRAMRARGVITTTVERELTTGAEKVTAALKET
ncbi:MAG TPA: alpha/beta hydrolase domain-containing protein [Caulobacteraceae bacterium]|nr:alpha/beta hydrolase domain-containing protein [Caulobacteraceae bacterium]